MRVYLRHRCGGGDNIHSGGQWVMDIRGPGVIRPGVGAQMSREAKVNFPQDVHLVVIIPHTREVMHHVADVAFHVALLDTCTVCCQCSHEDPICENM